MLTVTIRVSLSVPPLLSDTVRVRVQDNADPDVKDTHFGSELVDFGNRHVNPTNVWFTQFATENYVMRNLKIMLDPNYEKAERRKLRKRRKEYGQPQMEFIQESKESFTEAIGTYEAQEKLEEILD